MEDRIISSEVELGEISFETSLSPQTLKQYIGQDKVKENLAVFIEAAKLRKKPWIMFFYMVRLDLGKQPLRRLLRMKWVCIFEQQQDQRLNGQVI